MSKMRAFFNIKHLNRGDGEFGLVFFFFRSAARLWFKLLAGFVPFPVSPPQID